MAWGAAAQWQRSCSNRTEHLVYNKSIWKIFEYVTTFFYIYNLICMTKNLVNMIFGTVYFLKF